MTTKAEKDIQKILLAHAKRHPKIAWVDRANSGKVKVKGGWMQLHENGTPDLIGYSVDGVMIGIEVEDEPNYNSKNHGCNPQQIERIKDMQKKGCYVGVACCVEHVNAIMMLERDIFNLN